MLRNSGDSRSFRGPFSFPFDGSIIPPPQQNAIKNCEMLGFLLILDRSRHAVTRMQKIKQKEKRPPKQPLPPSLGGIQMDYTIISPETETAANNAAVQTIYQAETKRCRAYNTVLNKKKKSRRGALFPDGTCNSRRNRRCG